MNFFCHKAVDTDPAREAVWRKRLAPSATSLGSLKQAAEKLGKVDFTNLWAGHAVRLGREMPATN